MKVFKINPLYTQTIWGNNNIAKMRDLSEDNIGAAWEISAHKDIDCDVEDKKLSEVFNENSEELLGKGLGLKDTIRVGILDAKEYLSIQVHPDDEYGLENDNDLGKNECWYILKADDDSTLVAGTHLNTKEELKDAIENDTLEDNLRYIPVKAGDFIALKNGTLHALGGNIMVLELSNNSNTTYRFYDFHRKDSNGNERELHIDKSMDVVDMSASPEIIYTPFDNIPKEKELVNFDEFKVVLVDTDDEYIINPNGRFCTISNVDKKVTVKVDEEEIELDYLNSLFIPANTSNVTVLGNTRLIIGYPNK